MVWQLVVRCIHDAEDSLIALLGKGCQLRLLFAGSFTASGRALLAHVGQLHGAWGAIPVFSSLHSSDGALTLL